MENTARVELKEYLIKELDDLIELYSDLEQIQKGIIIARDGINRVAELFIMKKSIDEIIEKNKKEMI